jgi:adenylate cyclase
MGADEVGTLNGLTERRAILDKFIGDHGGRIANTAGDSVLAEFGSAVDAVQCAVGAQTALAEANGSLASDNRMSFRIGIHIGDVMVRAGDLFGDGVNIAARLQSIAKPGLRGHVRSGTQGPADDLRGPWCPAGEEHPGGGQGLSSGRAE